MSTTGATSDPEEAEGKSLSIVLLVFGFAFYRWRFCFFFLKPMKETRIFPKRYMLETIHVYTRLCQLVAEESETCCFFPEASKHEFLDACEGSWSFCLVQCNVRSTILFCTSFPTFQNLQRCINIFSTRDSGG